MGGASLRWTADTERAYLLALTATGGVRRAAMAIGRHVSGCYKRRERCPAFAAAWDATVGAIEEARLADGLAAVMPEGVALPPALTRTRTHGWTQQRQRRFLRALADSGRYDQAAARVGLSATSVRLFRRRSPAFQALCDKALIEGGMTVEEAAFIRAVEGWEEPLLHNGQVVGYRRRYSDMLTKVLLEREAAAVTTARKRWDRPPLSVEEIRREVIARIQRFAAGSAAGDAAAPSGTDKAGEGTG